MRDLIELKEIQNSKNTEETSKPVLQKISMENIDQLEIEELGEETKLLWNMLSVDCCFLLLECEPWQTVPSETKNLLQLYVKSAI